MAVGRPLCASKIHNKQIVEILIKALSVGCSIKASCGYAGIAINTYYNWYNDGLEASSKKGAKNKYEKACIEFVKDVDKAGATPIYDLVNVIYTSGSKGNTDDAKWLVERLDNQYNKTSKVVQDISQNSVSMDLSKFTTEDLKELLNEDDEDDDE